ncbi:DUF397 domain-containing protein [Streptomyces cucumeris]|uniref:DUF397 domain-containing protein n=1 Tax=Streptomyces cucumeris TaxID=2962890 RepID=UPI0020C9284E|nr:DUF397 domain-containing protein [Streptomyces sp. NEAU-Y11]MCP9209268.1 DUF397 domain-containing protein [Streptomyces sp. NEAU-Y11]
MAGPSFDFVSTAFCRDKKVGNCPQVALNVPGVVALRDSERPGEVVTMTTDAWRQLTDAVKAGEYDLSA